MRKKHPITGLRKNRNEEIEKVEGKGKDEQKAKELLQGLYEKLYFHEIDVREKISSRLQLPLTVGIALTGLLGTMIQNIERPNHGIWAELFWMLAIGSMVAIVLMAVFFYRAAWGVTYEYIPRALNLEEYLNKCQELYKGREDCDELVLSAVKEALRLRYVECASFNSETNDLRSYRLFLLTQSLVYAVLFTFLAFITFYIGGLDKNLLPKRPTEVKIVEPIQLKEPAVSTTKPAAPPPPPPAPPSRQVREDQTPSTPPKK